MAPMTTTSKPDWIIGAPRIESRSTTSRVSCSVDGEDVWFESDDVRLIPSIESFAGTMLVPALEANARLHVETPVNADWFENQKTLFSIYRHWWFPDRTFPFHAPTRPSSVDALGPMTGSCFTGGVDSFHTLLKNQKRIDALVFVHGYDIPFDDGIRFHAFERSMKEVAAAVGKKAIVVRSNLRKHHIFGPADWIKTHGAAIAAGTHVVSGTVGRLLIPASYYHLLDTPWGTHWDTDKLHSTDRVVFEHFGHDSYRLDKIKNLYRNPLFLKHVRVCWENRTATGNCSQCEKCLRTMAALEVLGVLDQSEAFDRSIPLVKRLNAFPCLPRVSLCRSWSTIFASSSDPALRDAVYRLLNRTPHGGGLDLPALRESPFLHIRAHMNTCLASLKSRS